MTHRYATAGDFRNALHEKLRKEVRGPYDLPRLRRQIAFERFLARVFSKRPSPWVLKGGFAMELRTDRARSTKDIDLAFQDVALRSRLPAEQNQRIHEKLQALAREDLSDFFEYLVPLPKHALTGTPFGGARFVVESRLAGKTFSKFHVDIAIGETILSPVELLVGKNWLSFAGIENSSFPTVTREQQFAEKIHAYTRPRNTGPSSRARDLVDLVLLISSNTLEIDRVVKALSLVFKEHPTHTLSFPLPDPPELWKKPYSDWAAFCGIEPDIDRAIGLVRAFVQPLWNVPTG